MISGLEDHDATGILTITSFLLLILKKSLKEKQLQLAIPTDCQEYLHSRMTLLASRLEEVNAMAIAGDLPDVDISDKGVKVTPLDNSVPSIVSPFADLVYGMLPHPKLPRY